MDSYHFQVYFRVRECNKADLNSNSALRFLIMSRRYFEPFAQREQIYEYIL